MNTHHLSLLLLATPVFAGEPILSSSDPEKFSSSKSAKGAKGLILPTEPLPSRSRLWTLRAGVAWRNIGETSIDPDFQSSGAFADSFFSPNPASGPLGQNADRAYDDGFVNIGAATPGTGLTTFWGYDNGSQIVGNTLNYTLGGGTALSFPTAGRNDEDPEASPYLELVYTQPLNKRLDLGFVTNFFFVDLDSSIRSELDQFSVTTTDSFNLGGIIPPLAPFVGTFAGPGPLLPNQPTSRTNSQTLIGTQDFRFESDTNLYSLGFGGELLWDLNTRTYFGLGAGVVINLADWEAQASVPLITPGTSTITNTTFRNSDNEVLFGFYLKTSAGYRFNERWSTEGFFRYDWNEDLEAEVGPTSFTIDLSGWSFGLGVGYTF